MTPTNTIYKCNSCQSLTTLGNPVPEYGQCPMCDSGLLAPFIQSPDELENKLYKAGHEMRKPPINITFHGRQRDIARKPLTLDEYREWVKEGTEKRENHRKFQTFKNAIARFLSIFNIMLSECAYCGKIKGVKKGGQGITSGICKKCLAVELSELERSKNELESTS